MAKVLVIRKPDRTVHQVPVSNKAKILGYNNRLPQKDQWRIEEMDEKEAAKLPYIDKDYVTAADAQEKLKEKDNQIKDLEARLKALTSKQAPETATNKIAQIQAAKTAEDVNAILGDDDRKTVKVAAEKMIASFSETK